MKIKLNENAVKFIEDKIGNMTDWNGIIEFALMKYQSECVNG